MVKAEGASKKAKAVNVGGKVPGTPAKKAAMSKQGVETPSRSSARIAEVVAEKGETDYRPAL